MGVKATRADRGTLTSGAVDDSPPHSERAVETSRGAARRREGPSFKIGWSIAALSSGPTRMQAPTPSEATSHGEDLR